MAGSKRIYGSGLWRGLLFLVRPCSPFWICFVAWSVIISPLDKSSILPHSVLHAADEVEFLFFNSLLIFGWVLGPAWELSLVAVPRASCCSGFSCGAQSLCTQAQELWRMGSVVVAHRLSCLQHVESSWTRDWTGIACIARQILKHWTTRVVSENF